VFFFFVSACELLLTCTSSTPMEIEEAGFPTPGLPTPSVPTPGVPTPGAPEVTHLSLTPPLLHLFYYLPTAEP
jgi:hypothetical protein